MNETFYQLAWYFFIYGFLGWCAEIVFAAWRLHKALNRGLLNGPICPVYGVTMVFILIFFSSYQGSFLFLILGCGVIATIAEYFTGVLMESVMKRKWWDYSGYRYNLGGYVCLPFSFLWGVAAAVICRFLHPFLQEAVGIIPVSAGNILLVVLIFLLAADFLTIAGVMVESRRLNQPIADLIDDIHQISNRLGRAIYRYVHRRMRKAHPSLIQTAKAEAQAEANLNVFAFGCSFHKLVWLFFLGAFLGDLTETVFCYVTSGVLMSRSSVVYGPFSIVWGLGIVVLTMMLHRYSDKSDRYIFLFGTVMGGAYEYICSVFTELVFGTVFWDYSEIPFNLGGRINLLYCFFWGLAAVLWIKVIYPYLSDLIEKVPKKPGQIISWIMVVFMTFNMILSAMALGRYSDRQNGKEPQDKIAAYLDAEFPDNRMERIYPNIILTD